MESDFIGKTVDLEYTTSDNYNTISYNAEAVIKNRSKRSNNLTGIKDTKKSLYGDVNHMGCILGTMENIKSVKNKLLESFYIQEIDKRRIS